MWCRQVVSDSACIIPYNTERRIDQVSPQLPMIWRFTHYTPMLLALAAFAVGLALYGWYRRMAPGAIAFTILMLAVAEWELGYALELGFVDLPTKLFWAKVQYIGIVTVPVAWVVFALHNQRSSGWPTARLVIILTLLPLATIGFVWTNEAHGLMWQRIGMDTSGPFPALDLRYGPWFWVHSIYSYLLMLLGSILLLRRSLHASALYRRQFSALLVGIIAPWIANGLYISGLSPVPHLDLAPLAFTITGAAFGWSLYRFRLLDIAPIARDAVIEGMRDGMIVIDDLQRVLDVNPAAARMFGRTPASCVGRDVQLVFPMLPLASLADPALSKPLPFTYGSDDEMQHYELITSPLHAKRGAAAGALLVIRDMTARVRAETALRASEARYRAVSELTSDYAFSFSVTPDGELKCDWVTDAFIRITGFLPHELDAHGGLLALIHPDDHAALIDDVQALLSGEPTINEVRIVTKQGETRWARGYSRAVWDADHQRVVQIIGASQDVTGQKRTEAALERERYLLRTMMNHSPDSIYLKDTAGRFLLINRAQATRLGIADEHAAIGKTDFDFFDREHAAAAQQDEARIIATGQPMLDHLKEYTALDGKPAWFSATKAPIKNKHGAVIGIVGIIRDMTDRRRAEAALRESEQRYRQMFEKNQAIKLVIDPETGQIVEANRAACDFYGYDRADLEAKSITDLNTLASEALLPELRRAATEQRAYFVFQHRLASGTIRDVEVYTGPIDVQGRRLLYSIISDVTERRRAEAALRRQNEYLAALYDTIIAVIDQLDIADVLEAIVIRSGALVGTAHGYMYLVEAETGDLVVHVGLGFFQHRRGYRIRRGEPQGLSGSVLATGQPVAVDDYQRWNGARPDLQHDPWHAVVGVPLASGSEIIGVLGLAYMEAGKTFGDEEIAILSRFAQLASVAIVNARLYSTAQQELEERKRAEAALAVARDAALEAARLKSEFLATMTHELRTPLSAIIGFTEFTLEEQIGPLNDVQRSNLQRVSRNGRNLLDLIDNILAMSKIDAGHMHMLDEPVYINEVVQGAVSSIETLVTAKQLNVSVELPPQYAPVFRGDTGRLRQVVINLLSNAVKFTPRAGTIAVVVEVGAAQSMRVAAQPSGELPPGEWLALSVQDSGIGIPANEHDRIWSEFYQTDGSVTRQYGGTGLGLAIVKRLTMLMGGAVGLRSAVDCGSTFTVWLPISGSAELAGSYEHALAMIDESALR